MIDVLRISETTALILYTLGYLAGKPNNQVTTTEITEVFQSSKHYLANEHQRLTKSGLMHLQRVPFSRGALGKSPENITLQEICKAMEG